MRYPIVLIYQNQEQNYLIQVPDIPGCQCHSISMDKGLDEILFAIEDHLTLMAEYGQSVPTPQSFEAHVGKHEYRGGIWAIVDIDITPFLGKSHKINVTLPELLIKKIDSRVSSDPEYKTRSGFLAKAAINELQKH
ncbi:type II toxin-antitoxin system HicB family antitoxin [Thalassotalea sp. PS06]|uniref:type II toxin-antitoxin system HicB family antitoxin n=1 Tax=Thalassotalea sp. PS06 TaxID=2594005 RepID=UPI001163872F|nr:type II toxin-antitoxin system HicB family antitoxin [Thalassotalea sp. PS06]QDP01317.1 HicB family protein [Thalassotalea sp. PS06]